ncbi:hypothetical protein TNCV_4211631 [Trichonephila clavipes]|nr:hypothetical protein TNCV_4211631 [Trichonephila clavipes]
MGYVGGCGSMALPPSLVFAIDIEWTPTSRKVRNSPYPGKAFPPLVEYLYKRDEAHFWLNGYVNKQNCRIWSEAIPQVYVETPLHPEKLTVWCALWAGGILLQKR